MRQPDIKHCILCEDARFEARKLVTIVGSYGALPDAEIMVANFALPVRVCLVFFGGPGEGTFAFNVQLLDSQGSLITAQSVPAAINLTLEPSMSGSVLAFWLAGAKFPGPGDYLVSLLCDQKECFRERVGMRNLPASTTAAARTIPSP